jgi:hypothetical protein
MRSAAGEAIMRLLNQPNNYREQRVWESLARRLDKSRHSVSARDCNAVADFATSPSRCANRSPLLASENQGAAKPVGHCDWGQLSFG